MKVLIDARSIESSWHRGIGRTFKELVVALHGKVDLSVLGTFGVESREYFEGYKVQFIDNKPQDLYFKKFDVFHVIDPMTILMGLDSPLSLPVKAKVKTCTFYDIIPKKNYSGGYSSWPDLIQQAYDDRLNQLSSYSQVCCISEATKADLPAIARKSVIELGTELKIIERENYPYSLNSIVAKILTDDNPYILTVGGCEPHKNLMFMKEVFFVLKSKFPDLRWILATHKNHWFDMLKLDSIPGTVAMTDLDDFHVQELYKSASCLCFPSLCEGLGLPPYEAKQLGCNVLCSDIPAIEHYFVKQPLKVSAWVEYLTKLFIGKVSQEDSIPIRSWQDCANDYMSLWQRLFR